MCHFYFNFFFLDFCLPIVFYLDGGGGGGIPSRVKKKVFFIGATVKVEIFAVH